MDVKIEDYESPEEANVDITQLVPGDRDQKKRKLSDMPTDDGQKDKGKASRWNEDDKQLLTQLVKQHGEDGAWRTITEEFNARRGKTQKQLRDYWKRAPEPDMKDGYWRKANVGSHIAPY
ncbi:hypothetical protein DFJ77DRAFT_509587 [Powellomyces hirtus]|nr:hypothetical protein DFJ77DRAFT_509587 [Powellomyces hirtus]